jgi:N4-gp56 family major capsid protein
VKEVVDAMKSTYLIPPFYGENYICICSVGFARTLKDDPDWEDAAKYGDPERLFAGEVGRYYGCRFVEETNVLSNKPGGTYKGEAVFFGEDPVVEAVAVAEELRAKIATDYGRDKGLAWYSLVNWALTWGTSTTAGEVKGISFTSA